MNRRAAHPVQARVPEVMEPPPQATHSQTVEDYLRAILALEADIRSAVAARLSRMLGVAPATVSATLRRLAREGLLYFDEDRAIRLTPVGLIAAEVVTRHHRLVERFLADLLHVPWRDVYVLADRTEHTISPRIERQLQVVLSTRHTAPHGNPIHPSSGPSVGETPLSRFVLGPMSIGRIQETAAYASASSSGWRTTASCLGRAIRSPIRPPPRQCWPCRRPA